MSGKSSETYGRRPARQACTGSASGSDAAACEPSGSVVDVDVDALSEAVEAPSGETLEAAADAADAAISLVTQDSARNKRHEWLEWTTYAACVHPGGVSRVAV